MAGRPQSEAEAEAGQLLFTIMSRFVRNGSDRLYIAMNVILSCLIWEEKMTDSQSDLERKLNGLAAAVQEIHQRVERLEKLAQDDKDRRRQNAHRRKA